LSSFGPKVKIIIWGAGIREREGFEKTDEDSLPEYRLIKNTGFTPWVFDPCWSIL
jgi:hypothetical protein